MSTTETETYFIEVTDTFGGEANYAWVKRFKVSASSMLGAIRKVSKECGYQGRLRKVLDTGELIRHDIRGACICMFTTTFYEYHTGCKEL